MNAFCSFVSAAGTKALASAAGAGVASRLWSNSAIPRETIQDRTDHVALLGIVALMKFLPTGSKIHLEDY